MRTESRRNKIHIIGSALSLHFCGQLEELADLTDFLFERLSGQLTAHIGLHDFGSCNLYLHRMSSKSVLSISVCSSNCSIRARSLCRPTLAAIAMIYSGRKTFAGTPSYSIPAGLADRLFCESGRGQESNREVFDEEMLALDAPAMCLKMRVDRWNSGGESFFRRDKD